MFDKLAGIEIESFNTLFYTGCPDKIAGDMQAVTAILILNEIFLVPLGIERNYVSRRIIRHEVTIPRRVVHDAFRPAEKILGGCSGN